MDDWRKEREQALLTLESSQSTKARRDAALLLVELADEGKGREEELAALIPRLLDDRDDRVRRAGIALAARCLAPEEAEKLLGSRLSDASSEVRLECAGQLADLGRPSSRGLLAAALEDESFNVRFEAARGMAALHHPAGIDVLIEALDHGFLRFRALGALAELGDPRALPAIQRIHGKWFVPHFDRAQAAGAMAKLGDKTAADWLMERSRKKRAWDRPLVVELLGEVKAEGAFERLTEILRDRKDDARGAAARALGRLGDSRALELLAGVLGEPDASADLVLDASEGLVFLGGEDARAHVQRALEKVKDAELRAELQLILEETR